MNGAVAIAAWLGGSEAVIGLTIVAIGTTAPEFATMMVATLRNERVVALGNIIGSSIYNILAILGAICVVAPDGVVLSRDILLVDLPLAAAAALVCVPVFTSDRLISRREGAVFVTAYVVYLVSLVFIRA